MLPLVTCKYLSDLFRSFLSADRDRELCDTLSGRQNDFNINEEADLSGRLQRDERQIQLLNVANSIILAEGTDALTLITLAEKAGVTKPVTYKHFGNRKSRCTRCLNTVMMF